MACGEDQALDVDWHKVPAIVSRYVEFASTQGPVKVVFQQVSRHVMTWSGCAA